MQLSTNQTTMSGIFAASLRRVSVKAVSCGAPAVTLSRQAAASRGAYPLLSVSARIAMGRMLSTSAGETVVGRCESKIAEALSPTRLVVQGIHDDPNGSHIIVEVVSEKFEGKRAVARQRMVYQALWEEMSAGGALHAVDSIIAKTPAEYDAKK